MYPGGGSTDLLCRSSVHPTVKSPMTRPGIAIQKANWNMAIDIVDFPIKNDDFPMKNGDFPIKNGDCPIKNDDFPWFFVSLPEGNR